MLRSLRGSVCALSHARHSSSAPVTSGATSVYPEAPSPLQEFSVVYTDRAMNHMSKPFCKVRPGARRCANARASRRHARPCPNSFPRKWQ